MKDLYCYDIETLKACFLFGAKKIGNEEWYWYEVSMYRNDMDTLVKWLREWKIEYLCGFNCIGFDMQVVQYILDNSEEWYDLSNKEVINKIYNFSQELISNQNYEIKPPYNEKYFDVAQIDLGRVHNFFNAQKRTSLKWIEYMTDQLVDEMPFDHTTPELTKDQCEEVRKYCEHDIRATEMLYLYTIGECDNDLYKGKDKIQERIDAIQEFKLPKEAISYSDVKIGEAVNLQGYMKEAGISNISKLYEKKKNRKSREFKFGDCIPEYVELRTPEMQEIRKHVEKIKVSLGKDEQKFPFEFKGMTYMVAKGGIHTENKPTVLIATDTYKLIEIDCSSQYPASIVKRGKFPAHLGKEWLINYKRLIQNRLDAKKKGKTDIKYKGLAETLKVSINGGGFGMTNSTYSVQYDPYVHFSCTIGNQFEILMLVERLSEIGIDVLSANTDGCLCGIPIEKLEQFKEVCKKWENDVLITEAGIGELEYTHYSKYIMLNVNSYLAVLIDGTTKEKKDFLRHYLLEKNKSKKMTSIALYEYYMNGISVEDTINNHRNIHDFCLAVKANKDYFYRQIDKRTGKIVDMNKLVKYYCSTEGGILYKIKHDHSDKPGVKQSICESQSKSQTIFNTPFQVDKWEDYKVDTQWYIIKAKEIIHKLEPETKRADRIKKEGKLELW